MKSYLKFVEKREKLNDFFKFFQYFGFFSELRKIKLRQKILIIVYSKKREEIL